MEEKSNIPNDIVMLVHHNIDHENFLIKMIDILF